MKRMLTVVAAAAFTVAPLAAQSLGMPNWSSPKGGTGVTISGDLAMPNADLGKGTAFGARATLGLANISLTAGLGSWKPKGLSDSYTSVGGKASFRVIGGSLIPLSIALEASGNHVSAANGDSSLFRFGLGGAVSVNVPTPGLSIEPYLAVQNRWYKYSGVSGTNSNIAWTLGANVGLGMIGLHLAYDSENFGGGTKGGIIGIGAHVALKAPIGM
ncbi:MAG TPA: hypothetical protein VL549_13395 [Gemmatimonadales bacterium]|jgi:hypothetical protein|nr:hypothetical protein [Gemmatimonadales bacterium]